MDWTTITTWIVPILAFMFTPGCCCSVANCLIATDLFNRANSTTLGSDWTEDAGDFEIDTDELITSDANARARFNTSAGVGATYYSAKVTLRSDTSGDTPRVFLGYQNSPFTCHAAEFEIGTGKVRIIAIVAGVETICKECDVTLSVDTPYTVRFCADIRDDITNMSAVLSVFVDDVLAAACVASVHSNYAGLGTGATVGGIVAFDNFELNNVRHTDSDCEDCGTCCWPLNMYDDLPAQIQVVLALADKPGDNLSGTYTLDKNTLIDTGYGPFLPGLGNLCADYILTGITGIGCDDGTFVGAIPTTARLMVGVDPGSSGKCWVYFKLYQSTPSFKGALAYADADAVLECSTTGPLTFTIGAQGTYGGCAFLGTATLTATPL